MYPLTCSMQSLVFYFSYYGTGQFARPDSCFILWTKCFEQKANSLCCNTFIIFLLASFEIPTLPDFILKYWVNRICPTNKSFFSKSQFSPNFHDLATRADPSLGLLIPISQHFVRLLPMKADSQLENNSALPKGSISKRGQKICFPPQECCQDRLLCSDSDQLCYFDILISRRSLADRPRVHIGVSPFYAWSINSGSKTRRTSTITSTSN